MSPPEQRVSPSFSAVAPAPLGPRSDVETLRGVVNQRLTAAVDNILGVFGKTVARYREHMDRQQRQLGLLRSEEDKWSRGAGALQASSWVKTCLQDPVLRVQVDQTDRLADPESGPTAALIKTEVVGDKCGESEPAASSSRLIADRSDWSSAAAQWELEGVEGQRSCEEVRSSTGLSRELPLVFSCKVCGETFQRKSQLVAHGSSHATDSGICGEHLEPDENLRRHRQASFGCWVCGQSFTLRGNLRTHMRIHSGERPFGCGVCGKSFGRRATLMRHVRSHAAEEPFTCTFCGRAFVEKRNLTVHLRTHTGKRPYRCSTCDRSFSQLSCFYKHPCQRRRLSSALVTDVL